MKNIFFLTIFLTNSSWAEYRVYQYYIKSNYPKPQDSNAYLVTSTLDPVSYKSYHGGNDLIQVDLLRTWICPGHSSANEYYCKSPYEKSLEEIKAI